MQNLKKLKGDASHRKFFRKKSNYGNSIVIQIVKFDNYREDQNDYKFSF